MVKTFPLSPLERVARNAGAERVSASAIEEMYNAMMESANKIAAEAIAVAKHARRVTVKREDIALANR
jgi:histone H3/H4